MAGSSLIRATVDTNLFVSAALRADGVPAQILAAWRRNAVQLVTSEDLDDEVQNVFARPELARRFRLPNGLRDERMRGLAAAEHVVPRVALPLHVRDPKDDLVLACALGGKADYLVTGDPDLLALDGNHALGSLRVVTPRRFLDLLVASAE